MLKLYGNTFSRAAIVQWYLEELGVPYEYVTLDMQAGAHRQPEFLAINPMGKVPAIVDGDFKLSESGAIIVYLADKYGTMPSSPEKRGEIMQWVLFANSTLATGIFIEANREKEMPRLMAPLNEILTKQEFITGQDFSVADVALGSMLNYIPLMLKLDLSEYPGIVDYIKRISSRPAFQKTIGSRGR